MAVNELSFNQLATVLKDITDQATGTETLISTDTASFVSVAQTALLTGYDNIIESISQVLSRTIFSVRPYNAKFRGLEVSPVRYGNHIRKLSALDLPFEDDDRLTLTDGESVDQYEVLKPGVLQTNYYGQNVFQKHMTIFRDQLDVAFSGPDEFGRFISMVMSNASDQIEQAKEGVRRATLCNLMGGVTLGNPGAVIHLVTLYNTFAGTELTSETVLQPDNWPGFVRWLCGHLAYIIDTMTERTSLYQINITGKTINRHTPKDRMKVYLHSQFTNMMESSVFSVTFHDDYLKTVDYEKVTFWQSIKENTTSLNLDASYIDNTGAIEHGAVQKSNVFGVIFDEESCMVCPVNEWSARTPFNARGGYSNIFWHFTYRYLNDFTEKCVVLLLD